MEKYPDREVLLQALNLCAIEVGRKEKYAGSLGLFSGMSGNLLFLSELYEFDSSLVHVESYQQKFEFLQEHLHLLKNNFDLSKGLAGIGWFMEYVNEKQGDKYDFETCSPIDDCLLEHLSKKQWGGEIELVSGLGGISVYAGRRRLTSNRERLLSKVINHYEYLLSNGLEEDSCWAQPANSHYRFDKLNRSAVEFNMGLAHGIPGIVSALLPALDSQILRASALRLITKGCDWLMNKRADQQLGVSQYPSIHGCSNPSRLGWCYGDVTIALTFARVGEKLGSSAYSSFARTLSSCAAKRNAGNAMVDDAGICHGIFGLFLIFHQLNKIIPSQETEEAAFRWLNIALAEFTRRGKEAFFEYSIPKRSYIESTGLLTGYSGIGLCLLAALGQDSDWSDCLLLN